MKNTLPQHTTQRSLDLAVQGVASQVLVVLHQFQTSRCVFAVLCCGQVLVGVYAHKGGRGGDVD